MSRQPAKVEPLAQARHPRLDALVARARERARADGEKVLALVHPCDALAIEAAVAIRAAGIARPLLVGAREEIARAAGGADLAIDDFEIVDTPPGGPAAAARATRLAREGAAAMLMKGSLHTDELMAAVVDRSTGLRGDSRITHAFVFDLPRYHKLLALADCVVNIAPNLKTKRDIIGNAVRMLQRIGIAQPLVAVVAAVETVNPAIPATLDAKALVQVAGEGAWPGAIVEGPFGFDNAFSAEAARIKKIESTVAGDADLMIMPELNAGNMLYKSFVYVGGGDCAGLVLGARVPIVLTSRADSKQARIASVALGVLTLKQD